MCHRRGGTAVCEEGAPVNGHRVVRGAVTGCSKVPSRTCTSLTFGGWAGRVGTSHRGQAGGPGLPEGPQSQPCLGSVALPEQSVERGVPCEQTELQTCFCGPEHRVAQTLPPNGEAGTGAEGAVGGGWSRR